MESRNARTPSLWLARTHPTSGGATGVFSDGVEEDGKIMQIGPVSMFAGLAEDGIAAGHDDAMVLLVVL